MALYARHTSQNTGSTVQTYTFNGQFQTITVLNRSTSELYFTSQATQGTAADGVPTSGGNDTRVLPAVVGSSWAVGEFGGGAGTDYVTIKTFCATTSAPFSIVAE